MAQYAYLIVLLAWSRSRRLFGARQTSTAFRGFVLLIRWTAPGLILIGALK